MIRPTILPSDRARKSARVAVLEKGMLRLIEKFLSLDQEWRHPGRIVPIDFPWEFDEGVAIRFGSDLGDLDQTLNEGSAQRSTRASIVSGVSVFSLVPKTRSQSGEVTP